MSTNKQIDEAQGKAKTKYDLKMERRKKEAEADKKDYKNFRIGVIAVLCVLALIIIGSIAYNGYKKYDTLHGAYIKVGDHDITKTEFDFYYNEAANSFVSNYGDYASMFGLDTSVPLAQQQYSEDMTWKDYFEQEGTVQIQKIKALVDEAHANGFTFDTTEAYQAFADDIAKGAQDAGTSLENYYRFSYGENATPVRVKPFVEERLFAYAYYDELMKQNTPSDSEVQEYYQNNKNTYDTVSYRSFSFRPALAEDASEEEIASAQAEQKTLADEMLKRLNAGEDFETLCAEYAAEDQKDKYGEDGSLTSDARYYAAPTYANTWLFDDSRAEGDTDEFEDTEGHGYAIVTFIDKKNDWGTTSASIISTLSESKTGEHVEEIGAAMPVVDRHANLKYLTLDTEEE